MILAGVDISTVQLDVALVPLDDTATSGPPAVIAAGHDAVSSDLLPSDRPGPHITGDVLDVLSEDWDAMIAFPPCTHLCGSGARWWPGKHAEQADAIAFVRELYDAPIPRVAIENPVGILSRVWRRPDQIIHPWQFGHGETKATCLWLRGLPPLMTGLQELGRDPRVHREPPGPDRWRRRSVTYSGIAEAMAAQWLSRVVSLVGVEEGAHDE